MTANNFPYLTIPLLEANGDQAPDQPHQPVARSRAGGWDYQRVAAAAQQNPVRRKPFAALVGLCQFADRQDSPSGSELR